MTVAVARGARPGNGRVAGHLGKAAAFARWDEFAPRHALRVCTARQSAPVHGLRTDAHTIHETLKTTTLANALGDQLQVGTDLLAPVPRHTTANGEDAEDFLRLYAVRVVLQIDERVISQRRFASEP